MNKYILVLLSFFVLIYCTPEIIGYWEGYLEYGIQPYSIDHVSENVSIIEIAFIAPLALQWPSNISTQWNFSIAANAYSPESILRGIKKLQQRYNRPKILLSIMDTPTVPWNIVDHDIFSYNLLTLIEDWNLDGVNIDAESSMSSYGYADTFISLIKSLRKHLGPKRLLTYSTYDQTQYDIDILNSTAQDIDIVQIISYWLNSTEWISAFEWYGALVNDTNKIAVGFAVTQSQLSTVQTVGSWLSNNSFNKMMLWSLTQDVSRVSFEPANTWIDTMYASLLPT